MKRIATNGLAILVLFYLSASLFMYSVQDKLIFKPNLEVKPIEQVFPEGQEYLINTDDGETLTLWHRSGDPSKPTILMFHGNSGNLSTRRKFIEMLSSDNHGFAIFSWRGYGDNTGSPSEQGLYLDARAALDWLAVRGIESKNILIYGESLGTGVAVQMATERDLGGIILGAPYTRIADIGKALYGWLPVELLLKHRFDSIAKLNQVEEPLVILHSQDDRVIPFALGRKLFDTADAGPKRFFEFTDRGHTGFTSADLQAAISWVSKR